MHQYWNKVHFIIDEVSDSLHEAHFLKLDSTKARAKLKWEAVWNTEKAVRMTVEWYRNYYEENRILTLDHLYRYIDDAVTNNLTWVVK